MDRDLPEPGTAPDPALQGPETDEPFPDEDGDFATEHMSLTVDFFLLDRPAESDAKS